jgi:hypothetical protein
VIFGRVIFSPEGHAAHAFERRQREATAGHDDGHAVAVEVADGGSHELDGLVREHDGREVLAAVVEPRHHRDGLGMRPIGKSADGHEVQKAVAVEVGSAGSVGAGQIADTVIDETAVAIFEPLDAMPRPKPLRRVVGAIAVGVDEVGFSVAVKVHEVEAATAKSSLVEPQAFLSANCFWRRLRNQCTSSHSCEISAAKSIAPSPSKSATGVNRQPDCVFTMKLWNRHWPWFSIHRVSPWA